ncbi:hypothetical protein [Belnapia arida]|nr:hypothetical protein [Belnapia arida]
MAEVKKGSKPEQGEAGFNETRAYHVNDTDGRPRRTVAFGSVTVTGPEPTPEQRVRNAAESEAALMRLSTGLTVPGVRIERKPGVPLVYANKHQPGTVIRELDGRMEVGTLAKDGTFKPLEAGAAE